MMEKEKLYKLYDAVLKDTRLTEEVIQTFGFSRDDISMLIYQNVLFPIADEFIFIDADGLSQYGFVLDWKRYLKKATLCYCKALEISPSCKASYLPIFQSLKHNKDNSTFQSIMSFKQLNESDANLFLFLFAFSHQVPLEKKQELKKMTPILLWKPSFEEDNKMEKMKESIVDFSFTKALHYLNDIAAKQIPAVELRTLVYRLLLNDAIDHKKQMDRVISSYYQNGKLVELKTYLEFQIFLTQEWQILLSLLQDYFRLLAGEFIPSYDGVIVHWHDAVRLKNYEKALQEWEEVNENNPFHSAIAHYSHDILEKIVELQRQVSFSAVPLERRRPKKCHEYGY